MPIVLFLNIKGGVAKTTTAVAVSEALAESGHRVLLIDADHQCASSELLLGEPRLLAADSSRRTLHDLLSAMLDEQFQAIQIKPFVAERGSNIERVQRNLSVIPCSFRINDFQSNRAKARRGFNTSKEFLALLSKHKRILKKFLTENYDFTIIDCPPSLALQVYFLLEISDGYVIPSVPDRISVRGARWLQMELSKKGLRAPALGMVWTLFREQNAQHKIMIDLLAKTAGRPGSHFEALPRAFKSVVPNATAIVRASEPETGARTLAARASLAKKYTPPFAELFHDLASELAAAASAAQRLREVPRSHGRPTRNQSSTGRQL